MRHVAELLYLDFFRDAAAFAADAERKFIVGGWHPAPSTGPGTSLASNGHKSCGTKSAV